MTETRQGTPAWFDARRGKLTASNFGAAAGVCPWVSRNKALRIAIGQEEWKGDLRACIWGTKNEKNAVKDYMIRTGNVVTHKGLFTHPDYPWLGGSPDGLVGTEGIIEVKCPFVNQRPHLKIPYHYYCQVNGLMEIMDREWCDFVSWTVHGMKIYRVYRDKELFDYLMERYGRFSACMKRGVADLPLVATVVAGVVVYMYRPTPIKKLQATGGAQALQQKYPGANYMFHDNPKNTELKDQSLGAGLGVPKSIVMPRDVLEKLRSDFAHEQLVSPGVRLVAKAVASYSGPTEIDSEDYVET